MINSTLGFLNFMYNVIPWSMSGVQEILLNSKSFDIQKWKDVFKSNVNSITDIWFNLHDYFYENFQNLSYYLCLVYFAGYSYTRVCLEVQVFVIYIIIKIC